MGVRDELGPGELKVISPLHFFIYEDNNMMNLINYGVSQRSVRGNLNSTVPSPKDESKVQVRLTCPMTRHLRSRARNKVKVW